MVELKIGKISPFADMLIRSALFYGNVDFEEGAEDFLVNGNVGDVLLAIADIIKKRNELKKGGKGERMILTNNDKRSETWKSITKCLNLSEEVTPEKLFEVAGHNVDKVIECGRVDAKLSLLKAEFYEMLREPYMSGGKYKGTADTISVILALAGYYGWKLGSTKVNKDSVDVLLLPLVSVSEGRGVADAFSKVAIRLENLPRNLGNQFAFSLWLAMNVEIDSSVLVVLLSTGNRISVKGNFTVDLVRLRKGIENVFTNTSPIKSLVSLATSDELDAEVDNFIRLVYNVVNGTTDVNELKVRGLRYVASPKYKVEIPYEFKVFEAVAKAVKL